MGLSKVMVQERLQKILAQAGVASRRAAEEMILAGRVAVDGQVQTALGCKADAAKNKITIDGKPLPVMETRQYWMVHKPAGVVCTAADPQGRSKILDLLPPQVGARLYPVGRLDKDSQGLVLLTNDGELAARLMHPRHKVAKTYRVWVKGSPGAAAVASLRKGVMLEDGLSAPARVYVKAAGMRKSKLSFVLHEGRKRQIRRMCEAVGHPVERLVRVGLGPLHLGDLPPGAARPLKVREIKELKQATGLISGCKASGDGVKKPSGRPKADRKSLTKNKGR